MSPRTASPLEADPLFADDEALRRLVAPHLKPAEWQARIGVLEAQRGFPKVDHTMGGRYLPAVRAFFDHRHGMRESPPIVPDQHEGPNAWQAAKDKLKRRV